jgi:hypothetical protein
MSRDMPEVREIARLEDLSRSDVLFPGAGLRTFHNGSCQLLSHMSRFAKYLNSQTLPSAMFGFPQNLDRTKDLRDEGRGVPVVIPWVSSGVQRQRWRKAKVWVVMVRVSLDLDATGAKEQRT